MLCLLHSRVLGLWSARRGRDAAVREVQGRHKAGDHPMRRRPHPGAPPAAAPRAADAACWCRRRWRCSGGTAGPVGEWQGVSRTGTATRLFGDAHLQPLLHSVDQCYVRFHDASADGRRECHAGAPTVTPSRGRRGPHPAPSPCRARLHTSTMRRWATSTMARCVNGALPSLVERQGRAPLASVCALLRQTPPSLGHWRTHPGSHPPRALVRAWRLPRELRSHSHAHDTRHARDTL